jgi:16S rRNA (cytosine967-C5)-methyltransferase
MIEMRLLNPGRESGMLSDLADRCDAVLVDAPCSGTGTWRRNPEARWRLTPERLARFSKMQSHLMDIAAGLVKPGGRIVFVTCSLLDAEGSDQASAFLTRHQGWSAEKLDLPLGRPRGTGWRLSPFHDGTDGFFIARLTRAC